MPTVHEEIVYFVFKLYKSPDVILENARQRMEERERNFHGQLNTTHREVTTGDLLLVWVLWKLIRDISAKKYISSFMRILNGDSFGDICGWGIGRIFNIDEIIASRLTRIYVIDKHFHLS